MAVIWKKVYNFASAKPKLHQYMKQIYRHALLTLLLGATCTTAGAATGDIINEDFSGFTGLYGNNTVIEKNGWTVHGCSTGTNTYTGMIKFELIDKSTGNAYATTPTFSGLTETCNAVMTFSCANTNSKYAKFTVTINGDGKFSNGKDQWTTTIKTEPEVPNNKTLKLFGVSTATSITFQLISTEGGFFVLDDVVISTADHVTLSESAPNVLEKKMADVTVGRTLAAGVWNTLCLPFNTGKNTIAQATGNAVSNVSLRTFSGFSENVLTFATADTITAGTPFLVKLAQEAENPTFTLVNLKGDIESNTRTVTHNGASMIGIFDPTDIGAGGLFLTASGKLKRASGSTTLKGLRAYFTVPGTTTTRLMIDDDATVIDMIEAAPTNDRWYAPDGRRYSTQPTRRGIYIKDGKKVIIR